MFRSEQIMAASATTGAGPSGATQPPPQNDGPRAGNAGRGHGFAPLQWLRRKLSGAVSAFKGLFGRGLRTLGRLLTVRGLTAHLPAPLRWLARLFAPGRDRGFGFWWMTATLGIALALALLLAVVLSPVAGIIALLVVPVWALVRRRRHKGAADGGDDDDAASRNGRSRTRGRGRTASAAAGAAA